MSTPRMNRVVVAVVAVSIFLALFSANAVVNETQKEPFNQGTDQPAMDAPEASGLHNQIHTQSRALSISLDNVQVGRLSQLQSGDSVDIYTGVAGVVKLFRPNVKVLAVGGGNVLLRVDMKNAANFAYEADNKQLWFVIRPVNRGQDPTKPATAKTVLR